MESGPSQSSPAQCWSNVVKNEPQQKDPKPDPNLTTRVIVQSCKSAEGISMAVVDANAVIEGGEKLHHLADKFVTVPEVLAEIRDPVSRHRLAIIPFTIDSMEPTSEALNKVIKFARATGDLQTLSAVDLKLIALTYTLEAQIHGTKHLRDAPPPIHTVNVKRLPENDMPGWGSNVPNLEEWEALEHEVGDGSNTNSRIRPLKDINLNVIPEDEQSVDVSLGTRGGIHSENHEDVGHGYRRHQRYPPKKKEINIEGKKMIADGVDASQGQFGDDDGDWRPAVSRSTHRRYLRRKARREYYEALTEKDSHQEMDKNNVNETSDLDLLPCQSSEEADSGIKIPKESEMTETRDNSENLSAILKQMRVNEDPLDALQERTGENCASAQLEFNNLTEFVPSSGDNANIVGEADEADIANSEFDHLEVLSHPPGSIDTSFADDDDSEQSWMLRSLSESSVACVTSDYAMQNVLLQIGLRLLAPGGMQIRQLHRFGVSASSLFWCQCLSHSSLWGKYSKEAQTRNLK
uniref:RNA-binding protein nob1 n=1 Tax=Rhizophora mucronata TaxID=61149 RepID=A0A2P2K0X9_RHIMU